MYVYTSGGRSRGKIVSSLRKRFGARQRNPLHDYLYVYICIYIYIHTLVVTVICEILSIADNDVTANTDNANHQSQDTRQVPVNEICK